MKKKEIVMKMGTFIKEHKKLIPTLEKGSKALRVKEAKDQLKELKAKTK